MLTVKILHSGEYLRHDDPCILLWISNALDNAVKEITALDKLHDDVDCRGGVKGVKHFDDVRLQSK